MLPIYSVQFVTGEASDLGSRYVPDPVTGVASTVVKLAILCAVGKYLSIAIPFLAVTLYFVQSFYLRTSRQVRLLDIEAKAPLFKHFIETVRGISSVRAFGWYSAFATKSDAIINDSQKPIYMLFCIQQWLTLVLDLVVGAIAVILVAVITSFPRHFQAASIGVALNLLLTFNQTLAQAIKEWTMMETSIGAVARIQSFVKETPQEEIGTRSADVSQSSMWPSKGSVIFSNVTAAYR